MAASDLTTAAFILKHDYSTDMIAELTKRDHVLYAQLEQVDGFVGDQFNYVIRSGNTQGIGGTLVGAQANASVSKGLQFAALRKAKFSVITVDGEAIAATKGNRGAFYDLLTMESDAILIEHGDSLAYDLYRDVSCVRGKRSSISGNIVTLAIQDDARNFKEGMTVSAATAADGTGARAGTTTVTAVDEDGGTVTLANAASITSFADNDFLFRSTESGTGIEGLEVCTPLTAPTNGDSFRGKDRSANVKRYAGSRVNDTATSVEENLGLVAVNISKAGRSHAVTDGYLNPSRWWECVRRLNAKVEYEGAGGSVDYGFEFFAIHTSAGSMKIFADPDCPMNRGRVSKRGSQYLRTLEGYPHIITDDGLQSLRQSTANGIEVRNVSWGNLIQTDPVAQGVVAI